MGARKHIYEARCRVPCFDPKGKAGSWVPTQVFNHTPHPLYTPRTMSFFNPIMSDPQLAIPKRVQTDIARAVSQKLMGQGSKRYLFFMCFMLTGIILIGSTLYLLNAGNNATLYIILLWSIGLPIAGVIQAYIYLHFGYIPQLRRELHDRGYDICLNCSYVLTNLPNHQTDCPECGTQRTPITAH